MGKWKTCTNGPFFIFSFFFVKSEASVKNKGGAQLNMNLIVGYSYMLN